MSALYEIQNKIILVIYVVLFVIHAILTTMIENINSPIVYWLTEVCLAFLFLFITFFMHFVEHSLIFYIVSLILLLSMLTLQILLVIENNKDDEDDIKKQDVKKKRLGYNYGILSVLILILVLFILNFVYNKHEVKINTTENPSSTPVNKKEVGLLESPYVLSSPFESEKITRTTSI